MLLKDKVMLVWLASLQCHTTQMHWRDARVARDWRTLREQVEGWQTRIGERWTPEDVDAVARHLNATIYRHPVPSEQAVREPAPSPQNSIARCSTAAPLNSSRGMNISRTWPSTHMLGTASGMVPLL
jgi:uncharacterized membrane protein